MESTIKKLAYQSWGSTIDHKRIPKFSREKIILSPRVVSGAPRLRQIWHFEAFFCAFSDF